MVLPPGKEDALLCPVGVGADYSNPKGLTGSASRFWRCKKGEGKWVSSYPPPDTEGVQCAWGDCRAIRMAKLLGAKKKS